jgi:hypothetical protein
VGGGQFMDVARPTGSDCVKDSRGVALADFNGDGRLDMVINNNNETPTLYINNFRKSGNAIELKLVWARGNSDTDGAGGDRDAVHAGSNRDAIGAFVRLTAGGKTMTRQVEAGSGYASEAMLPLHFGLGDADHIDEIEITWPSGLVQRIEGESLSAAVGVNRLVSIEEGRDPSSASAKSCPLVRPASPAVARAAVLRASSDGVTH